MDPLCIEQQVVEWTFEKNGYCGEKKPGYRAYCHPDNYDGIANLLYRNNGDGTFTDISEPAGVHVNSIQGRPMGKALGIAPSDIDGDGLIAMSRWVPAVVMAVLLGVAVAAFAWIARSFRPAREPGTSVAVEPTRT
jgi:hypothetical protein